MQTSLRDHKHRTWVVTTTISVPELREAQLQLLDGLIASQVLSSITCLALHSGDTYIIVWPAQTLSVASQTTFKVCIPASASSPSCNVECLHFFGHCNGVLHTVSDVVNEIGVTHPKSNFHPVHTASRDW